MSGATFLAYVDAVPGRLYPLVATLLELAGRGHTVAVRCGIDDVERLRSLGLEARSLRREIERFAPDDWRARTRFGALSSGLAQFGERAPFHGVPVVVVPFGRDRPEVARRVEVAGAGVRLRARKLTPERLREAVRRAIERQPGAERIAAAFAKAGGAAAAADLLEELTLEGAQPRRQAVATLPALKSPTRR